MLDFKQSAALSLGVELELQLVNRRDYDLTRASSDLLTRLASAAHGFDIKPEITESMIEIATGVHDRVDTMHEELLAIRALLLEHAGKMNIGICGGGAHPFQKWERQRIFNTQRYLLVSELYGYLAKQFTVYGQHIHIGCPSGDWAIRLANFLSKYLPDFIALSASSPFYQGVDTGFASSRLTAVNAFPLSGRMPGFSSWDEFTDYFNSMKSLGIVESMKDFYWDLRPKPEYGTVEIRVCDSPLDLGTAVALAAYAQTLAAACFDRTRTGEPPSPNLEKVHSYNRFQACRFGLAATVIDPDAQTAMPLSQRIQDTIDDLMPYAKTLSAEGELDTIRLRAAQQTDDSGWLRDIHHASENLSEVVRSSVDRWGSQTL
jgi:carboxylate-amine ligase